MKTDLTFGALKSRVAAAEIGSEKRQEGASEYVEKQFDFIENILFLGVCSLLQVHVLTAAHFPCDQLLRVRQ